MFAQNNPHSSTAIQVYAVLWSEVRRIAARLRFAARVVIFLLMFVLSLISAQPSNLNQFALLLSPESASQKTNLLPTGNSLQDSRSRLLFEKGIRHYNAGRYYSALDIFRRLKNYPLAKNPQLTASYLMCMKSYFQIGRLENAREVGREFLTHFPQSAYLDDVRECFGDMFLKEGRYGAALDSYLKGGLVSDNDSTVLRLDGKIMRLADGFLTIEEIKDLLATELETSSRSVLTLLMANGLLAKGKTDEAALLLFRIDPGSLPVFFQGYYETLRSRTYRDARESTIVGVVVPLTGYDKQLGKAFVSGVNAAVASFQHRISTDVVLEVVDNEGDNLKTSLCVKTLSANPNVVAIIGPLSTDNSIVAAATVGALSVPLLVPVSTEKGLADANENVYQMNPDLFKQGRYAADYAVSVLGLKTLAVLAPADRLGKELTDGFVQRVDELGANVVAIEWYSGIPVDLSSQFRSLRKVGFRLASLHPDASKFDVELDTADNTFLISLTDFFPDEEAVPEVLSRADSSQVVLSTIECVYLPIHAGDISYVASQFFSHSLDARVLGNANWYEPEELDQELIGPNLEGMIVLTDYLHTADGENGPSSDEPQFHFETRREYKMALFGYDVMSYLSSQLGHSPTRAILRENLSRSKAFRGVSKNFSFVADSRRVNSSMHVLMYQGGRFRIVGEVMSDSLLTQTVQSP